jgi:hypothetical protein
MGKEAIYSLLRGVTRESDQRCTFSATAFMQFWQREMKQLT